MASRVLFQRRSLAPLATMALGGMVMMPATVYAEAPNDFHKRKSIYDDVDTYPTNPAPTSRLKPQPTEPSQHKEEEQQQPRGPTPTDRLAVQIGNARVFLYRYAAIAEDKLNDTMNSAFHLEQSFTSTLASLAPPRESGERLMPGAIYVLVAAMAGSIITRNRNILLRASVPLALGVGAGWTVLPVTMRNVSDLTWEYEKRVPVIAETHLKLRESIQNAGSFATQSKDVGVRYVDEKVTDAREVVEGWVKQGK